LAALVAWRIAQRQPATFSMTVNDYGFELLSSNAVSLSESDWRALLSPEALAEHIDECLNAANLAKGRFRDIARIAGLVQQGYPGRRKATRQIQASSSLIFDVLSEHEPGNRLLEQARREVLESQLEFRRIESALQRARRQEIALVETERLTPLAFPLWADRLRAQLSSEAFQARIDRMLERLEPTGRSRDAV
jgi:ATP-dependent Lhr-like helicase